jgi:4-methyl-5(b-hydroxyethyl)-thiazole monophosphate biosynthesis
MDTWQVPDQPVAKEKVMAKKAIIFLAEGFEEVEAVTPIDYLRRAGVEVTIAALGGGEIVTGSHGIPVKADVSLAGLVKQGKAVPASWDAVVLPGGLPGANNLAASAETGSFIRAMAAAGKWVCAICASPALVLAPLGVLAGRKFTCYPGMEKTVSGARWSEDRVVIDGNIITSRGAGTAGYFAAAIIGKLVSEETAEKISQSVLLP